MKDNIIIDSLGHFLETGDTGSLQHLKDIMSDSFFNSEVYGRNLLSEDSEALEKMKNMNTTQRAIKIIDLLTMEFNKILSRTEEEYESRIKNLKNYTREIENTSKIIGRQNLVLSYFYQAGQMLSSSLDNRQIIYNIVEMISNVFEDCFCCLMDVTDNNLLQVSHHNRSNLAKFAKYFNEVVKMRAGEGCEGVCVEEMVPCQIYDVYKDPAYVKFTHLADLFNFQSILSVPLITSGNVVGCISIYSYEKKFFTEEEIRILTMFSDQAARAMENARLYQKTDSNLRASIKELSLMHELDQAIINSEKLPTIAMILIEGMEMVIPGGSFALDLERVDPNMVYLSSGLEKADMNLSDLSHFSSLVIERQGFIQREWKKDNNFFHLYGFPIVLQDNVVGVFWICTQESDKVNSEMMDFVMGILAQIAIAIDKRKTSEQLVHAEKMNVLGSLLSGIAHELNNPLSRILGLAQTAQEEKDLDEIFKFFKIIAEEALRCKRIMEDFLAFARKYKAKETVADINALIVNTLQLWKYQKKTEDMKIVTLLANDLPKVYINTNRIQQVFLNLIVNAYDAATEMNMENKVLRIETRLYNSKIRIIFQDNGPGIPVTSQETIFQPFFTTKPQGKGTGLGLSLSRDIIREHDGDIWVENSFVGEGATFIIELPMNIEQQVEVIQVKEGPTVEIKGTKILIADDDQLILKLMSSFLKREGVQVETATNGKFCLAKLEEQSFDLIISDMIMPDIRGDKLIEILENDRPHLLKRLILCTGDILDKEKLNELESKGVRVLYKPFELSELKKTIQEIFRNISES